MFRIIIYSHTITSLILERKKKSTLFCITHIFYKFNVKFICKYSEKNTIEGKKKLCIVSKGMNEKYQVYIVGIRMKTLHESAYEPLVH